MSATTENAQPLNRGSPFRRTGRVDDLFPEFVGRHCRVKFDTTERAEAPAPTRQKFKHVKNKKPQQWELSMWNLDEIHKLYDMQRDFLRQTSRTARPGTQAHVDLWVWIDSIDANCDTAFSFDSCCRVWEVDPSELRQALEPLRGTNVRTPAFLDRAIAELDSRIAAMIRIASEDRLDLWYRIGELRDELASLQSERAWAAAFYRYAA